MLASDLDLLPPRLILEHLDKYRGKVQGNPSIFLQIADANAPKDFQHENIGSEEFELDSYQTLNALPKMQVNLIESKAEANPIFTNILFSVNNYLIRNRGASSDFNLMKDIVERNVSAVEEDINLSVSIPLYLGLMLSLIHI